MVHLSIIEARMSQLGFKATRWFKAEVRELQHVLMDNEKIITMVQGRYFGGYALLVATDRRLLLIDKKALFLNVEDIRYDMISEIDFSSKMFDSTVSILRSTNSTNLPASRTNNICEIWLYTRSDGDGTAPILRAGNDGTGSADFGSGSRTYAIPTVE